MKTLYSFTVILGLSFFVSSYNRIENSNSLNTKTPNSTAVTINSNDDENEISNDFFKRYSDLKKYKSDVMSLYKNRTLGTIWYDEDQINEFASVLYDKAKKTNDLVIPYQKEIDLLFDSSATTNLSKTDADMLLSSLYIMYAKKSNSETTKKVSYDAMLKDFMNYSTIEEVSRTRRQ
ncbi:hypothetical protein ACQ9BO_10735 [Flavobacterium sp. P21]|uniref:hypothetical protein n=1 Tax=Flavobacterium sp. P21 TaxID=3423948 RepID=UPI003D672663